MDELAPEQYCYLTTTGRKTGKSHTVEIWFAMPAGGKTLYILSGGGDRSDWVKNLLNDPVVSVRIGTKILKGRSRIVTGQEEDRLARKLVVAKYYGRDELQSSGWEAESLSVALDLEM